MASQLKRHVNQKVIPSVIIRPVSHRGQGPRFKNPHKSLQARSRRFFLTLSVIRWYKIWD